MVQRSTVLELPILAYSTVRSACFSTEYLFLNAINRVLPGGEKYATKLDVKKVVAVRKAINGLLKQDAQNIAEGIYPVSVLMPESPLDHLKRLPRIAKDGLAIYLRRLKGRTTEFDKTAKDYLNDLPRYYRRNFHFQTNGYLSSESAELYEHQVEMLFGGAADAMRRLIIAPLREKFGNTDGKGLTFLEVGAGTGRATRFVKLAFPKAKIVVTDLSDPYLKLAQKKLSGFNRLDFVQADGANLPFQDGRFDAVYSVFLYHELPMDARNDVIAEGKRVLKKDGFFGLVDSLQTGDNALFDELLENFPENFHEPFYRNYIEHPMKGLLKESKLREVRENYGMFSKVCWAHT